MNEKLIVKDFGPIKNAALDLKKVTVFIGPQGSGKSALAKLAAIFRDGEFLIKNHLEIDTGIFFKKYQADFFLNKNTSIIYETDNFTANYNRNSKSFLSLKKSITSSFSNDWYSNLSFDDLKLEWEKIKDSKNQNQIIGFIGQINPFGRKLNKLSMYLPTERFFISSISDTLMGLLSAEVALQKSTIDFGNNFEIARSNNMELKIDYLNVTYKFDGFTNLVFYNETDSMPLSASASGHQSVIPLHLTVEHFAKDGNTHFIVEEPELNLYPTTQNKLIGFLADKCTQNGNELLMTTHSPYVLTALNNLIFAFQVAQALPERADEIAQIIPREQWLNPDDVAAYYIGEDDNGEKGGVHSIFNSKTGLIGQNELDEVSDELGDEFSALMNIYRTRKRETVN